MNVGDRVVYKPDYERSDCIGGIQYGDIGTLLEIYYCCCVVQFDKYEHKKKVGKNNIQVIEESRGNKMLNKRMLEPQFYIGEVIDLSYKFGGLPNRILIKAISCRECDNEWQYDVLMENIGERTMMSESFISERLCQKKLPVYHVQSIANKYSDGFRYCGNYDENTAEGSAMMIAKADNIASVIICPALNRYGKLVKGVSSIWIKYISPISDNGQINGADAVKVIK